MAEFERNLIRERTKAGLAATRARGRMGGRPRKPNNRAVRQAAAMPFGPMITKTETAQRLGVTRVMLNVALARQEARERATTAD